MTSGGMFGVSLPRPLAEQREPVAREHANAAQAAVLEDPVVARATSGSSSALMPTQRSAA